MTGPLSNCTFTILHCLILFGLCVVPAASQDEGQRYALLIGGLGGSPDHTETFQRYLFETRRALVERFQFSEGNVVVLAERGISDEPFVDGVSTAEAIRDRFTELAGRIAPEDQVYVLLFGHGSFDGRHAHLNIPRRDLSAADYASLIDDLDAERVVFVNTASSSAPFVDALSAEGRIVISATRTATQRNETRFPRYFVEALTDPAADVDKDGALSMREVFAYASERTSRDYDDAGLLATEHALLDDAGDGRGTELDDLETSADGDLAAVTYLTPRGAAPLAAGNAAAPSMREKETLERAIAELKSQKQTLSEDRYYAELETLLVRLARLNERIEEEQ